MILNYLYGQFVSHNASIHTLHSHRIYLPQRYTICRSFHPDAPKDSGGYAIKKSYHMAFIGVSVSKDLGRGKVESATRQKRRKRTFAID